MVMMRSHAKYDDGRYAIVTFSLLIPHTINSPLRQHHDSVPCEDSTPGGEEPVSLDKAAGEKQW